MIERKTWDEFRGSKLLWWVNRTIHIFGWAICVELNDQGVVTEVYPSRVKFRGFQESSEEEGFEGLAKYIKDNIEEIYKETKE